MKMYLEYDGLGNGYELILALHENGKMQGGQLRDIIKNYDTAVKTARKLESVGLIKVHIEVGKRTIHWYELTEKGQNVAKFLKQAQDIIDSD